MGFVHTDQTYTVTFGWNDQSNDMVLAQTRYLRVTQDGDEVYSYDIVNAADASDEQPHRPARHHPVRERARAARA